MEGVSPKLLACIEGELQSLKIEISSMAISLSKEAPVNPLNLILTSEYVSASVISVVANNQLSPWSPVILVATVPFQSVLTALCQEPL